MTAPPHSCDLTTAGSSLARLRNGVEVVTCLAAGSAIAVWQGQDGNWDLLNYHLYNVFWLFERRNIDFLADGLHNFLSPLPDIPFYMIATKWLPTFPRLVAAIQGLYYGALICIVLRINRHVFSRAIPSAFLLPVIATAIDVTGAAAFPEAGTTFNDVQVAVLILSGVLALVPLLEGEIPTPLFPRAALAGGLFGAAAGMKLTGIVYAPGAALGLTICLFPWRRSLRSVVHFSLGWTLAFAITYGWWGYLLWEMMGNPVFPFLNRLFRSEWYPASNFVPVYQISTWFDLLAYPVYWLRSNVQLVTELPFRDARFALGLLAAVILLTIDAGTRQASSSPASSQSLDRRTLRFIGVFVLVSYALWLWLLIALRYAIAIEALQGTLIVSAGYIVAGHLLPRRMHYVAVVVGSLAVLAVMAVHTIYPPWARRDYGDQVFAVTVPAMPPDSMIIVHDAPIAYALPFVQSPNWSAVGVTLLTLPGYRAYEETHKRIAAHRGPLFVLYDSLGMDYFRPRVADLGAVWDNDNCRPIESNMSWGWKLCEAQRR